MVEKIRNYKMTDHESFEKWHKANYKGYVYAKSTNGSYLHARLDLDYGIWQAATLAERWTTRTLSASLEQNLPPDTNVTPLYSVKEIV
jgi:hypothetical protein